MKNDRYSRRQLLAAGLAGAGALALGTSARAQAAWPQERPIRMLVNFPAGGSPDLAARTVSAPVSQALGQQIVIDNRSGAGGLIGSEAAAKSAPDGYTFLCSSGSGAAIVPLLTPRMPFDHDRDLVPVAAGIRLQLFLMVRAESPFQTFQQLVDFAKRNPGRLSYGSPGNGTSPHIAGEMMKSDAGISTVHIPYRGSNLALQDLLGGTLDYVLDPGTGFPQIRAGRARLLAITAPRRLPLFPEAPTLDELGLKGFDAGTTHGFWAPAGVPEPVIARMNAEINRALMLPASVEAFTAIGAEPTPMSPRAFGEVIKADRARYGRIIRERNITAS
jgi:tripartite-type tricarboxylate transporter receptor subunit TctC